MEKLLDLINEKIEINTNHINNFPLETEEGTKKVKEKFHKNAVMERNKYIDNEKNKFISLKKVLYKELKTKADNLFPEDKTALYTKKEEKLQKLERLVILNSTSLTPSFKLNLDFLLSKIKADISLVELNACLKEFIKIFSDISIYLTIKDFQFSMFTETYMKVFLENYQNSDLANKTQIIFEKIYFQCPFIINQIKLNLQLIIKKYTKELEKSIQKQQKDNIQDSKNEENLLTKYLEAKEEYNKALAKDEFINLQVFLDKKRNVADYLETSPVRLNNFNKFVTPDYSSLTTIEKTKFKEAILNLNDDLIELKEYYRYETIIQDLITKYKERSNFLNNYTVKAKEIAKEEKARLSLLKKYSKALGKGLFAKKNKTKSDTLKIQVNNQITKLDTLYTELNDLSIYKDLDKNINDASTIFDILNSSLLNFYYLNQKFTELFSEEEDYNLETEFYKYYHFILNPNNYFLRKVSALTDYNITDIIADKYKLLGLNIVETDIDTSNISQTFDTINYLKTVYEIESSQLSLPQMSFICSQRAIPLDNDLESFIEDKEIL